MTEVVPVISDSAEVNTNPSEVPEEGSKGEEVVLAEKSANNIHSKTMEK